MTAVKYNFVIDCPDAALAEYRNKKVEEIGSIVEKSYLGWCLQTYLFLSQRKKLEVICSNRLLKDAINIVHSDQLLEAKGTSSHFIVCVQADYPPRQWAQYHLVQNKAQLRSNTSFIPFWLQPGLMKRDSNRTGVQRIAYSGQISNGNLAGSAATWKQLFDPHGIEFVTIPNGSWHDLRSIDVLVGIRSFDARPHNTKPATKLFNAWHAQIPFIGGYDSAFQQVGKPGEDYLLAKTQEEVVAAVLQLRNNPQLYATLVQNGREKAKQYSIETISETWEEVLSGPVQQRYEQWKSRPAFERTRFNAMLNMGVLFHESKQLVKKVIAR